MAILFFKPERRDCFAAEISKTMIAQELVILLESQNMNMFVIQFNSIQNDLFARDVVHK